MGEGEHKPVLFDEALVALELRSDSWVLDGTFGRGGHSGGVLAQLGDEGRLLAMDKDPVARSVAESRFKGDSRFTFKQDSFANMDTFAQEQGVAGMLNGVLLDLGVSSPQLDDASRGFSFKADGPLDMRMNPDAGESAAQWVARVSEADMVHVFREYGEERFAGRIARAIVTRREEQPFLRTADLADVIRKANPKWEKHKDPATRCFQAIRIAVNAELSDLEKGLAAALDSLAVGGRLAVISFHSLEDRMVKRYMRKESQPDPALRGLPLREDQLNVRLRLVGKAIKASKAELEENPRARSAVLRVAEKLS